MTESRNRAARAIRIINTIESLRALARDVGLLPDALSVLRWLRGLDAEQWWALDNLRGKRAPSAETQAIVMQNYVADAQIANDCCVVLPLRRVR